MAYPGMDTSVYPGDSAMKTWKASSPYVFTGYYLPSPCHPHSSWVNTRETLSRLGWGLLPIYVGRQLPSSRLRFEDPDVVAVLRSSTCSSPTKAYGATDGHDANAKMREQGFDDNSAIFLDVEYVDHLDESLTAYIQEWLRVVASAAMFSPGIYCHWTNAEEVRKVALDVYREHNLSGEPLFWIVRNRAFALDKEPDGCGFAWASAWQGRLDTEEEYGGVRIKIDANVGDRPNYATT